MAGLASDGGAGGNRVVVVKVSGSTSRIFGKHGARGLENGVGWMRSSTRPGARALIRAGGQAVDRIYFRESGVGSRMEEGSFPVAQNDESAVGKAGAMKGSRTIERRTVRSTDRS